MKKFLALSLALVAAAASYAQTDPYVTQPYVYFDSLGNIIPFKFGKDAVNQYNLIFPAGVTTAEQNEIIALPQFNNFSVSQQNPTVTVGPIFPPGSVAGMITGDIAENASFAVNSGNIGIMFQVTTAAATITATFPAAATLPDGWYCFIRKTDAGAGIVINSALSDSVSNQGHVTLYWTDGTVWYARAWYGGFDASGNLTISAKGNITHTPGTGGTIATGIAGTAAAPVLTLTDVTTGWYRSAANVWAFAASGVEDYTISGTALAPAAGVDNTLTLGASGARWSQGIYGPLGVIISNGTGATGATLKSSGASGSESLLLAPAATGAGIAVGTTSALATNATNGFPFIPSMNGVPTGVPTGLGSSVPLTVDTANSHLYIYNSAWVDLTAAGNPAGVNTQMQYNNNGSFGATTQITYNGTNMLITENAIGSTSTDAVLLTNTTAAANGAQQWSPRVHWSGKGWETNGPASRTVDWIAELQPVQGAANPTGNLVFSSQVNAGGYTAQAILDSAGGLTLGNSTGGSLGVGTPAPDAVSTITIGPNGGTAYIRTTAGGAATHLHIAPNTGGGGGAIYMDTANQIILGSSNSITFAIGNYFAPADLTTTLGFNTSRWKSGWFGTANDATSTDGVVLLNNTAATNNNQKWSTRIRMSGNGWETNTGASQEVDFITELQPVQGVNNPSGNLVISSQINAGGYNVISTLDSVGDLTLAGGITTGSTTLHTTTVALTNNAGASAGTLTNAPAVGNPTKWFPVNDNGTIRNVPSW